MMAKRKSTPNKAEFSDAIKERREIVDVSVTEREARAAYIAMSGKRSAVRVRESFVKQGYKTPSQRTFDKWRARYEWVRLAREHDETVASGVANKIAKAATAQAITRAMQFDTLATESLTMAIDGLKEIDVASLKATDIRALAEISERAARMYELLEGRATDRADNLTRGKMDTLMDEMKQELEERLARIKTVH
jgi:hypothetical protein